MKNIPIILFLIIIHCNSYSQQAFPLSESDQAEVDKLEEMVEYYHNDEDYNNAVSQLSKIAFIYWDNQRGDKAIEYFLETIQVYERLNDLNNIQKVYSNIALIYIDLEDVRKSREFFEKSLEVRRQTGDRRLIASGLVDLAYVIGIAGDYELANEYLLEAMNISLEENNEALLLNIYNQLSRNYNNIGIVTRSDEFRQKYLTQKDYLSTQSMREEFQVREEKSQAEIRQAQLESRAQELQMQVQQLRFHEEQDSIKLIVKAKEDSLVQAAQRDSLRQQSITLLEQEKELQQAQLEKQRERERTQKVIISYGVGVLLIGTFLLFIVFRNYRAKRRANKQLEFTNKEIENKSNELQEAYYKIEDQNLKIQHSINYAQDIQKALMPPKETLNNYLPESFIFFKPLHTVSGDFYWFKEIDNNKDISNKNNNKPKTAKTINNGFDKSLPIKNNKFIISAVDCTGHGVPGGFMSMIGYNLLDEITQHGITNSNEILSHLHKGIRRTLKQEDGSNSDGMDLSLCVINKREQTVQFSGAQNSMIYIQNGEADIIKGDRMSIGGVQKEIERNFSQNIIKVDEPTWFYIFSDGYIDQFGGPKNRKFLIKNLKNLLLDIYEKPMHVQEKLIKQNFYDWKRNEDQIDDVLLIGFKLGGEQIKHKKSESKQQITIEV